MFEPRLPEHLWNLLWLTKFIWVFQDETDRGKAAKCQSSRLGLKCEWMVDGRALTGVSTLGHPKI